jgi:type II secretory pathway pseudopilin PulG
MAKNDDRKGFSILELLLVVASLSTVALVAGTQALDTMERTRQKVTANQMRQMAGAMQVFQKEFGGYPFSALTDPSVQFVVGNYADTSGSPVIVPDLIQFIPPADGWGIPYRFHSGPDPRITSRLMYGMLAEHYLLYSLGSDRAEGGGTDGSEPAWRIGVAWLTTTPINIGTPETHCYQSDIVWGDSFFLQAPAGKQKKC